MEKEAEQSDKFSEPLGFVRDKLNVVQKGEASKGPVLLDDDDDEDDVELSDEQIDEELQGLNDL